MSKRHNFWYFFQISIFLCLVISFKISEYYYNENTIGILFGSYIFPIFCVIFVNISIFLKQHDEIFGLLLIIFNTVFFSYYGENQIMNIIVIFLFPITYLIRTWQYCIRHKKMQYIFGVGLFFTYVYCYTYYLLI